MHTSLSSPLDIVFPVEVVLVSVPVLAYMLRTSNLSRHAKKQLLRTGDMLYPIVKHELCGSICINDDYYQRLLLKWAESVSVVVFLRDPKDCAIHHILFLQSCLVVLVPVFLWESHWPQRRSPSPTTSKRTPPRGGNRPGSLMSS